MIGVEIVEEAVVAARENAVQNGLKNCEFIAGDVLEVLDVLERNTEDGSQCAKDAHSRTVPCVPGRTVPCVPPPDIIILDPPRDGVHPKALKRIAAYGVKHIVYVSCKPQSLLKDLPVLREAGYQVTRSCAIDQFPWTRNVETILHLKRVSKGRVQ